MILLTLLYKFIQTEPVQIHVALSGETFIFRLLILIVAIAPDMSYVVASVFYRLSLPKQNDRKYRKWRLERTQYRYVRNSSLCLINMFQKPIRVSFRRIETGFWRNLDVATVDLIHGLEKSKHFRGLIHRSFVTNTFHCVTNLFSRAGHFISGPFSRSQMIDVQ